MLFVGDISGQYNLWQVPTAGGWPEPLTANPEARHDLGLGSFSPDGRYLAYSSNERNPEEFDIYLRDLETGQVRMVCGDGGHFFPVGFSPDGRYLVALDSERNSNQDLWLVDLASGERRNLTPHPGREVNHFPVGWAPDGSGYYFLTNDGREYMALARYDVQAGGWEYLLTPDWAVEHVACSGDGRLLAYVVNEAGNSVLRVRDLAAGADLPLPALPPGVIHQLAFAPRDQRRRLFLRMGTYAQAAGLYVLDLESGEFRCIADSMLGRIPAERFVAPELVFIPTFDGRQVPAWLYKPQGLAPGERVPAVLSIHGGPETQERPEYKYNGLYQYLLSHGVAVLAPNIRGSTGFGTTYQRLIYRDWGGGDLKDIEACAQYLQSLPWVDPQRLGVWGRSYGGFATLSAVSRLPQYWACGAEMVGPANLVSFVSRVPPHWRRAMKSWIGDPEEDREFLLSRSPITYVQNVRCPLLVIQGANDPRVAKAESDQMVERLRALGREVEYLVFDDEGHDFAKRGNALRAYGAVGEFLVGHLVGPTGG